MKRASGALLHITSLPSQYGIGDLGSGAKDFADFLERSGQTYWQILPLSPTDTSHGNTPYSSISAFAGNSILISPDGLANDGYISKTDLEPIGSSPKGKVNYPAVSAHRGKLLRKAYANFRMMKDRREYEKFCSENPSWLDDFAEFSALKDHFGRKPWSQWPKETRDREESALKKLCGELQDEIDRQKFIQFIFFKQWARLKKYCNEKGIKIIGDMPIYVNYDSVDVWTSPASFKLDSNKLPVRVAGVPPDYFSSTGQLWGNPVYDWDHLRKTKFDWWIKRTKHNIDLYDLVRIDHFRGFAGAWEVPRGEETAERGRWVEVPGGDLFKTLTGALKKFPVIAEDLGVITDDVKELMRHFGFPGMKVLIFAFGGDPVANQNAPHNHVKNCVVYTGTHDSPTVRGWFEGEASEEEKRNLYDCLERQVSKDDVAWEFVKLAMGSVADTAIIPMQDVLGLPGEARMNVPGTTAGNWEWRLMPGAVSSALAKKLFEVTRSSGRAKPAP